MKARAWAPVVAGLLLVGSGCGQLTPGTASVVDGEPITVTEVDRITEVQCEVIASQVATGQGQVYALSMVKQSVLVALIETTLNESFAAEYDIEISPELAEQVVAQAVPRTGGEATEVSDDFQERYILSQLAVAQAGADGAGQELTLENISAAYELGARELEEWQQDREVVTDARYNPGADGRPGAGSGSVSEPVSSFAAERVAAEPDPEAVGSLPASQRCGG